MNNLFRMFLGLIVAVGLAGVANAGDNGRQGDVKGESTRSMSWVGKSGSRFHNRVDHSNRILSMKREGSRGLEIEFQYEGDSQIPVAARIKGKEWKAVAASVSPSGQCTQTPPGLVIAKANNNVARMSPSLNYAPSTRAPTAKFGMRKAVLGDGDPLEDEYWETNNDLEIYAIDYVNQLENFWDNQELKDKVRCNWQCDWIFNWAMVGCAAMFEVPPVAAACVLVQTGIKWTCQWYCDKD